LELNGGFEKMEFIDKNELLEMLEKKYGDLNDDGGCYVVTNNGHEWLSINAIVEIINDCMIWDD
jgi:hypothetical protein